MDAWPEERRKNPVEATVVGATPGARPIPAMVVGDKRDFFGKRLGAFGLALLILFFLVSTYVQSAQNGRLLERASQDRTVLINGLEKANITIAQQIEQIRALQIAIAEQNKLLKQAGIPLVSVGPTSSPQPSPMPTTQFSSEPSFSNNSQASPNPIGNPIGNPTPQPSPNPSPSPSPTGDILALVCNVTTVICLTTLE